MIIEMRAFIPANETEGYGAWGKIDPKNERGMMFYQRDQYLQSFLRRAHGMDAGKEHDAYETPGFKLMLWVGLQDMNGVKIFDDDILAGYGKPSVVSFEPTLGWGTRMKDGKWNGSIRAWLNNSSQVIGNIHQNPELLV